MKGVIIGLLILVSGGLARASDCYYYWTQQCVEVIDASKRQLRQSVLISPSINYFNSGEQQCESAAETRQATLMAPLLEAFNATASTIRGCNPPLEEVSLRLFEQPAKAAWHYNRAQRAANNKTIIPVDNLPLM